MTGIFKSELGQKIYKEATVKYKRLKMAKHPYTAPETLPGLDSDGVRAICDTVGNLLELVIGRDFPLLRNFIEREIT